MTGPANDHDARKTKRSTVDFLGRLVLGGPPALVAVGAITGLGLLRGVPMGLALGVGLALTLLPTLGLASRPRRSRFALVLAAWLWCLLVLVSLPLYFPGEREEATDAGLRGLASFLGPGAAQQIGHAGASLVALLGTDRRPAVPLARTSETFEAGAASRPPTPAPLAPNAEPGGSEEEAAPIELTYHGDENSLRIEVDIDGPEIGEGFTLIFDTGATFTTLDRASLRSIGVDVPPDSPRVTLHTAGGIIEASLVLVDAVWLGSAAVEWVTVAVCDSCANPPAAGLLGLNVSQRFHVSIDHERRTIGLKRRRGGDDRSLDIRSWLQIRSEARESWNRNVDVELTGFNSSRQEIESAVIHLECGGAGFAIQVDAIPPHGESTTRADLPRGTDCRQQALELSRAYWKLDRFQ